MKSMRKKISVLFGVLCLMMVLSGLIGMNGGKLYSAAAAEILSGKTSQEIVSQMGMGWNVGNTFDATGFDAKDIYGHEKSWGNPAVTKELIDAVAAAGFKTLRIPITWTSEIAYDGKYTIRPEFLARIKEVVDYAYEDGLFVIINVHHESWVNRKDLDKAFVDVGVELDAVWSQISDYFADYDQHLIFEGMNEPRMAGTEIEWTGNEAAYEAINFLDQVFTDAVRSNGKGFNAERCLMIPQYAASCSSSVMASLSLPTYNGEAVNNLIVSVHSYTPYDFCLSDKSADFDINNSSHTGGVDAVFATINNLFLSKGIPAVMGETGATNTKDNTEARERWAAYTASKAASYGVPIVIWDNGAKGNSGGECHAWIDRTTCEWNYPTVVEALINAANSTEWGSALASNSAASEKAESCCGLDCSAIIWQNPDGLTSTKEWDYTYIQLGAQAGWFAPGRDIYIAYKGSGEPKIVLDSEAKQAWWIPVDPDSISSSGDYKLAKFSYDSLLREMNKNGVDDASQLRYYSILAANGSITTYETGCIGGSSVITFKANGKTVSMGSEIPAEPEKKNGMTFEGWYSTIDYRPGTEYNGGVAEGDITVYAKYSFEGIKALKEEIEAEKEKKNEDLPPIFGKKDNTSNGKTDASNNRENTEADKKAEDNTSSEAVAQPDNNADTAGASVSDNADASNEAAASDDNRTLAISLIAGGAALIVIAAIIVITRKRKKK